MWFGVAMVPVQRTSSHPWVTSHVEERAPTATDVEGLDAAPMGRRVTSTPSSADLEPSYRESLPIPALAKAVRAVWIQTTADGPYVQRHLPTGGVELQWPLGGRPHVLGPLTGPFVEVIPARTVVVGVRFHPNSTLSGASSLDDRQLMTNRVLVDAIRAAVPDADIPLLDGRRDGPGSDPYLDISRLHAATGFTPAFDPTAAVADYVTWRPHHDR